MRNKRQVLEEVSMIIGGLDLHRAQITFDYVDTVTGEVRRGQIRPATREALRCWLGAHFQGRGDVKLAVEGCTGWRFVVEELQQAGVEPHVAEPAETSHARGPKMRAKTDRIDARLLRELLLQERLPESAIPPQQVLEVRCLGRLYQAMATDRRAWLQRIHAQLFHQGAPAVAELLSREGRARLASAQLSPAGRLALDCALSMVKAIDAELEPLRARLEALARALPGPRALDRLFGIGPLCAVVIWAELGDVQRFHNAGQVVRLAGLDISVWSSAGKRSAGHLVRQGPPMLRWALYEAAKSAARRSSPDYQYYQELKQRLDGKRATISIARKLARRCYHTLRELADEAPASPAAA
jgi:transposase